MSIVREVTGSVDFPGYDVDFMDSVEYQEQVWALSVLLVEEARKDIPEGMCITSAESEGVRVERDGVSDTRTITSTVVYTFSECPECVEESA